MSEPLDAAAVAEFATRLGLVDAIVARECVIELDDKTAPPEALVRMMERKRLLTPFQSTKLLKGETEGYFLGGYRLLYKIASGSFGRVYRGDDPRSNQIVAIKVLRKRWTEDAKRIESFEREGRLGLTMEHPNIVRILAVSKDTVTGQHFMVMEFVEGGNLKDILAIRKKMEPEEALHIMEECAAGLAYAQSRGLSHRDIKTSNILLGTDKVAKLVDFGLAGIHEGAAAIFTTAKPGNKEEQDAVERTVDYAGLEKATNLKSGDIRSDIYFLGHVLYEMIAGTPLMPPTRDKNVRMSRRRFEQVDMELARGSAEHHFPPPVVRLISKAVALDPFQRFQTPSEYHDAIRATRVELKGNIGQDASAARRASGPLTVFIVEANKKLQDVFREKFKKLGFRVLISLDATQAIKRYQQQPFHAMVVDAGTVAQEGVDAYRRVTNEAKQRQLDLGAVLILNEDQAGWETGVKNQQGGTVLIRPVTMKQLSAAVIRHVPELQHDETAEE